MEQLRVQQVYRAGHGVEEHGHAAVTGTSVYREMSMLV